MQWSQVDGRDSLLTGQAVDWPQLSCNKPLQDALHAPTAVLRTRIMRFCALKLTTCAYGRQACR